MSLVGIRDELILSLPWIAGQNIWNIDLKPHGNRRYGRAATHDVVNETRNSTFDKTSQKLITCLFCIILKHEPRRMKLSSSVWSWCSGCRTAWCGIFRGTFCWSQFHRGNYDLYTIPDGSCAGTNNTSERAFVHTQNANFGSIFVPAQCYGAG